MPDPIPSFLPPASTGRLPTTQVPPSYGYAAPAPVTPAVPVTPPVVPQQPVVTAAPVTAPPSEGQPVLPPPASTPGISRGSAETPSMDMDALLTHLVDVGGSDLHITASAPPMVRLRGDMVPVPGYEPLSPETIKAGMYAVMTEKQQKVFEEELELDFALTVPGQARFRVNCFQQQGHMGAVLRVIPWDIKTLDDLNMPEKIGEFPMLPRGFVLVTGPTGSGKSTTLAAMIDRANRSRQCHIMTIEDPVEFIHDHRSSIVNQREVGEDTWSFAAALKHVLRQDPDIILVGELRDLETISVALTAAETGHLVFATLHTQSAEETVTRIIDVFPPEQQQQVRTQLSATLQGVICQTLCKTADGHGRVAAVEVMVCDTAIRNMIRDGKLQQVQSALQSGAKKGMQTLNQHLAQLTKEGRITQDEGLSKCSNAEDYLQLVGSGGKAFSSNGRLGR